MNRLIKAKDIMKDVVFSGFRTVSRQMSGQRQRVALACSLVIEPKLLLLDDIINLDASQGVFYAWRSNLQSGVGAHIT